MPYSSRQWWQRNSILTALSHNAIGPNSELMYIMAGRNSLSLCACVGVCAFRSHILPQLSVLCVLFAFICVWCFLLCCLLKCEYCVYACVCVAVHVSYTILTWVVLLCCCCYFIYTYIFVRRFLCSYFSLLFMHMRGKQMRQIENHVYIASERQRKHNVSSAWNTSTCNMCANFTEPVITNGQLGNLNIFSKIICSQIVRIEN